MAKKRSRAREVADEEVQENLHQRLSGIDSNTPPITTEESHWEGPNHGGKKKKKKGRGASKLKLGNGKQKPKEFERNDFGQPTGDKSVKYSSFLGCLVRECVPYTVDKWENVETQVLDKMWDCLKMTYNVEERERDTIIQKLDKLWRDGKSRLQRSVRLANAGQMPSRDIALLKPERMDKDQWDYFVKRTLSDEFQEKSQKFRAMRANQKMPHTTSRKGFARLHDKMKKQRPAGTEVSRVDVWIEGHKKTDGTPSSHAVAEKMKLIEACSGEKKNTTDIANDAIKEVFKGEARGRVRGMGFGVTPSKVGAQIQQNQSIKQLQSEMHSLREEMKLMQSVFSDVLKQKNMKEQANNESVSHERIPENAKCKLFHWEFDGAVAEGRIASIDPKAKVHGVPLGKSFWKVWIDRVLVEQVDLIRPNDEMEVLDDAKGSTVAWLSKFTELCE